MSAEVAQEILVTLQQIRAALVVLGGMIGGLGLVWFIRGLPRRS